MNPEIWPFRVGIRYFKEARRPLNESWRDQSALSGGRFLGNRERRQSNRYSGNRNGSQGGRETGRSSAPSHDSSDPRALEAQVEALHKMIEDMRNPKIPTKNRFQVLSDDKDVSDEDP